MCAYPYSPVILVLEDDPHFRRLLKVVFSREGYKVFTAADGQEALDIIKREASISLVTTDNKIPGMSGMDFLDEVEKISPRILKVMISSIPAEQLKPHMNQPGFLFGFHQKPARMSEVLETIRLAVKILECKAQTAG